MPIPFDDLTEPNPHGAVAWLRFVEETDGKGIRAALLQTSAQGEPLAFCLTRMDARDPSLRQSVNGRLTALPALAKSLFRATSISPALILGLADEIPARMFADDLQVKLSCCLVRPFDPIVYNGPESIGSRNENSQRLLWATEQPVRASDAHRVLDDLMGCVDPFEPFDRVTECISEAFEYQQVWGLVNVSGLTTVVSLFPPAERTRHTATSLMRTQQGIRESKPLSRPRERSDLRLAERLWAILAAPQQRSPSGKDLQLKWPGELMPFQEDGVRALLDMERLLLADDMGLGKTIQAVAAMRILRTRREVDSCLVVAPAGVLDQWRREISEVGA